MGCCSLSKLWLKLITSCSVIRKTYKTKIYKVIYYYLISKIPRLPKNGLIFKNYFFCWHPLKYYIIFQYITFKTIFLKFITDGHRDVTLAIFFPLPHFSFSRAPSHLCSLRFLFSTHQKDVLELVHSYF